MNRNIRLLCFIGIAAASAARLEAAGTTGADFLRIGVGARPAGLGEAFVAVADETSGMFYNPAGGAFQLSPELQAMHSLWLGGVSYSFLGYSHPTLSGTFGAGIQYLAAPSTPRLSEGVPSGEFTFSDGAANLQYARRLGETFSAGLVLRGIRSTLDGSSLSAFTGDFGLLYRTLEEGFSFGLAGQNLFGTLGEDKLPFGYRAGMAFKASLPEHYSDVLFSVETGRSGDGPLYYAAGVEHWGARTLGLRLGYKYEADERQRGSLDPLAPWRAGISLRIRSLALDYSYQPFAALEAAHRVSLTWRTFGWTSRMRMVPAQTSADPKVFSPNNDGAKDSTFFVPHAADIREIKYWELVLADAEKRPVMKFSGKDVLPKILSWEGQTETGGRVPEGRYLYQLTVEGDGNKRGRSPWGEVRADLTAPQASLALSSAVFSPDGDGIDDTMTVSLGINDDHGIDQWQLSIINARRKPVKVIKSTSTVAFEFSWNGTDDYYGTIVPNGVYTLRLTAWDVAGNRTTLSEAVRVHVPPKVEVREVVKEIQVKEEKRGLVVNLSSQVLYAVGKSALKPQAFKSLDEVVNLLQTYPENNVLIEGHTDSSGSRKRNVELSSARAWAVYSYLVKHGVARERLTVKGYGPDRPVVSNKTPWGRAQNRRVEIIILKKE